MMLPRDRLYAHLRALAASRLPMETNGALAERLGLGHSTVNTEIQNLARHGLVRVEYTANGKQRRVHVEIDASRTEWQAPHLSVRPPTRGPKVGTPRQALSFGFSDAALYGADADAVREVRRRGREVVRAPGGYKVDGRVVSADRLRDMAQGR
jgi:DNA-binding transcriptional MocR family regulator